MEEKKQRKIVHHSGTWTKEKNPQGRPALPSDIKKAKALTTNEFIRLSSELLFITPTMLDERLNNPNTNNITQIIGRIIKRAANELDEKSTAFLLDRLLGRTTDIHNHLNINQAPSTPPTFVVEMDSGGKFLSSRPKPLVETVEAIEADHFLNV